MIPDKLEYIYNINCLKLISEELNPKTNFFLLKDTSFVMIHDQHGVIHWRKLENDKILGSEPVLFSEVFEQSPTQNKEELAYHFDIFQD